MSSAEVVVNALKDLRGREDLNRYDESLCADIKKRIEGKLSESNMSITEKTIFVSRLRSLAIFFSSLLKSVLDRFKWKEL